MPSPPLESSPPLSAVERQVLTLLARGHTTKSIAATLDLSVYAVNERLREARRKTGAASSRELARRRLATQENWDKQIGVPGDGPLSAEPESPGAAMAARRRSRSFVIMLAIVAVFAFSVVGMQIAPPANGHAQTGRIPTGGQRFTQYGPAQSLSSTLRRRSTQQRLSRTRRTARPIAFYSH